MMAVAEKTTLRQARDLTRLVAQWNALSATIMGF